MAGSGGPSVVLVWQSSPYTGTDNQLGSPRKGLIDPTMLWGIERCNVSIFLSCVNQAIQGSQRGTIDVLFSATNTIVVEQETNLRFVQSCVLKCGEFQFFLTKCLVCIGIEGTHPFC